MRQIAEKQAKLIAETSGQENSLALMLLVLCITLVIVLIMTLLGVVFWFRKQKVVVRKKPIDPRTTIESE